MPTRVAEAVAAVLPVDGASISVAAGTFRLPLGASSATSAHAERLQFTAGDGPCLTSLATGVAIEAPEPVLTTRWPALAQLWATETGFRSASSRVLLRRGSVAAALNLFFVEPDGVLAPEQAEVDAVASAAGLHLRDVLDLDVRGMVGPPGARVRQRVWIAIGMGMSRWHLTGKDTLDRLRALAFARGTTLDELAVELADNPRALAAMEE